MAEQVNMLRIILAILLLLPKTTFAEEVLYNCPDLHNKNKQTIEPLVQGIDGWFFRQNDLRQDFALSPETLEFYKRLSEALSKKGTKLLFAPVPTRAFAGHKSISKQVDYQTTDALESYYKFVSDLRNKDILVPDLYSNPQDYEINGVNYLAFKRDIHWLPEGARITASKIADLIKQQSQYDKISKKNFETKAINKTSMMGTITKEINRLCEGDIAGEEYNIHQTTQLIEKDADSLFGDNDSTPITLIGSSFSALSNFNFAGFLSQKLNADVANYAISGGMLFNSITSYLSSPNFQNNRPPFIIWEAQAIYDLNSNISNQFRQLIPAAYGECDTKDAIINKKVTIENGKASNLLQNIKQSNISGNEYFIFLKSSNFGFNKFTIELEYDDGDGEWFNIDRSERYENKGRFFIEISDEIESTITDIKIDGMNNINTDLEIRICKVSSRESEA